VYCHLALGLREPRLLRVNEDTRELCPRMFDINELSIAEDKLASLRSLKLEAVLPISLPLSLRTLPPSLLPAAIEPRIVPNAMLCDTTGGLLGEVAGVRCLDIGDVGWLVISGGGEGISGIEPWGEFVVLDKLWWLGV